MLPHVVLHNAVSADGRTTGLSANLELFYQLASRWQEDITLAGSDTIIAALQQTAPAAEAEVSTATGAASGGRLAVVDSRGRIKDWRRIKAWPFWSSFVSLSAASTPPEHSAYLTYQEVDELIAGVSRVDLTVALEELNSRYGAQTVRVESGGTLNAALLRQGLVDEISILLHPLLIGGMSPHTIYRTLDIAPTTSVALTLRDCEKLANDYLWLHYEVKK